MHIFENVMDLGMPCAIVVWQLEVVIAFSWLISVKLQLKEMEQVKEK